MHVELHPAQDCKKKEKEKKIKPQITKKKPSLEFWSQQSKKIHPKSFKISHR
jgi:hypothetical protein